MRDATFSRRWTTPSCGISIHASHAGCDVQILFGFRLVVISIHASHAGCDAKSSIDIEALEKFQSTHPMRDATKKRDEFDRLNAISIHASHAGCDAMSRIPTPKLHYFNPRIPCGMRRNILRSSSATTIFQSTHPMRDATPMAPSLITWRLTISIHASHAGCDGQSLPASTYMQKFQSTHPMRDAT